MICMCAPKLLCFEVILPSRKRFGGLLAPREGNPQKSIFFEVLGYLLEFGTTFFRFQIFFFHSRSSIPIDYRKKIFRFLYF